MMPQVILALGGHASPNLEPLNHLRKSMESDDELKGFIQFEHVSLQNNPFNTEDDAIPQWLEQSLAAIERILPDLIIFQLDDDFLGDTAPSNAIRELAIKLSALEPTLNRPILTVIDHTTQTETRESAVDVLIAGADDTFDQAVDIETLKIKLLVHLRRNLELLSTPPWHLPGKLQISRYLQRRMNDTAPWGVLQIGIKHFEEYAAVYGELPKEQALKTILALLGSVTHPPDAFGQVDPETFVLVTSSADRAEKLAPILCRQFDTVVPNLYSDRDRKRGFIISVANPENEMEYETLHTTSGTARRIPLIGLSIGVASSNASAATRYDAALQEARRMMQFSQHTREGSSWLMERQKLTGNCPKKNTAPTILLIEPDAALSFLLVETLQMQGYQVLAENNAEAALKRFTEESIHLVIMDNPFHTETHNLTEFCQTLKTHAPDLEIIFTATSDSREAALAAGANLYIPKPYDLLTLFHWVTQSLTRFAQ